MDPSELAQVQDEELEAVKSIYEDCIEVVNNEYGKKEFLFRTKIEFTEEKPLRVTTGCECSEKSNHRKASLQILPPLTLRIQLPANYPGEVPPKYGISCMWLSREATRKLKGRFDQLWTEAANSGVLFSVVSFLQTEMLEYLNISDDKPYELMREFRTATSVGIDRSGYTKQDSDPADSSTVDCVNESTSKYANCSVLTAECSDDTQPCSSGAPSAKSSKQSCNTDQFSAGACGTSKSAPQSTKPRCFALHTLVRTLAEFDSASREAQLANSRVECAVCFDVRFGHESVRIDKCGHIFCAECLRQYVDTRIKQNDVVDLQCPAYPCETPLPHAAIRRVIDSAAYERFEKLLLQASLATMTDVVYCPRPACGQPVLTEPASNMAICSCGLVFCSYCYHAYHGVAPCSLKNDKLLQLRNDYLQADADSRKQLEVRHGKHLIKQAIEEAASIEWLHDNAKPCPTCGFSVQKLDGCNKMTCTKCNGYFCWLCTSKLNKNDPYAHYRGGSACTGQLFLGMDTEDDMDEDEEDWSDEEEEEQGIFGRFIR